jgi:hypothetical protein
LAQAFAVGAWITSMMALTSCYYISVRPIPEEGAPEMPKEGFGWISRQVEIMEPPAYGKHCTWYTAEERSLYFDSMWNAGFAMAVISVILGLVVMSITLCTCCVAFQLPTFDGLFWTCVICFVAQALTFLSWGSELCDEMECTWSSGTGMNLAAAMMWVWAANMIKSFPEALPPRKRGNRRRDNDEGDEDDDEGAGDVYLSNRNAAPHESGDDDGLYRDDDYDDWDNANARDNGDGYYDEDGNWVANDPSSHYESNDEFDTSKKGSAGGYSDYDKEDGGSDWAGESDADNFDDTAPLEAPDTKTTRKQKRIPKKKKKDRDGISSSSMSSFDNDDWDDERGSFRY